MADNKDDKDNKVSDKKATPLSGAKTEDSKREGKIAAGAAVEGANRDLEARRQSQHGDLTSSTGGANNPGQHGRDGGEINGQTNNPAPSEDVVSGERANDSQTEGSERETLDADKLGENAENKIKKL